MQKITFTELCGMDVINMCDGQRLGHICDLEIDTECGRISAVIIPCDSGSLNPFAKREYYVVTLGRIECIGNDAVLVKIPKSELVCCEIPKRRRSRVK